MKKGHKDEKIISHDNLELDAIQINSIKDIFEYSKNNQIDAKHVAWIMSRLYNNICFIHF